MPCPAGTYSNYLVSTPGIDRVSCTDVDAGYYSNGTVVVNGVAVNATDMTPCPAGTYQPDEGQASCIDADPGYYSSGTITTTKQTWQVEDISETGDGRPGNYHDNLSWRHNILQCR